MGFCGALKVLGLAWLSCAAVCRAESDHREETGEEKISEMKSESVDPFLGVEFETGTLELPRGEMFYWYFPYQNSTSETPFVLWLAGGPGCSSEYAVLNENGPFRITWDGNLAHNSGSWAQQANLLYIDPVLGLGLSKSDGDFHPMTHEDMIADDVAQFLELFLKKYPNLFNTPFYITGESYAGHFIPVVTHYLLFDKLVRGLNIQGMAIGNGWVHPGVQYPSNAEYLNSTERLIEYFWAPSEMIHNISGLQYTLAKAGYKLCDYLIRQNFYSLAMSYCDIVSLGIIGHLDCYDIDGYCNDPPHCMDYGPTEKFLNRADVQARLGVPKMKWESCNKTFLSNLVPNSMTSMIGTMADLLDTGLRVLVYYGDKDFVCNWMGGLAWAHAVKWKHQEEFNNLMLESWLPRDARIPRDFYLRFDGTPIKRLGEIKKIKNFTFLKIEYAGHMVTQNQPLPGLAMITEFLYPSSTDDTYHKDAHLHEA